MYSTAIYSTALDQFMLWLSVIGIVTFLLVLLVASVIKLTTKKLPTVDEFEAEQKRSELHIVDDE